MFIDSLKNQNLNGALVLKNDSFMNEAGLFVKKILEKNHAKTEELLIIHDDLDFPLGVVKLQKNRSSAGHKGVQSVIDNLGTQAFARIRIGIGRPDSSDLLSGGSDEWVLQNFGDAEKPTLKKAIGQAQALLTQWL